MAQGATVYNFDIDLADEGRGVYESLAIRAARHPSESAEFLLTRVLAYALEYTEGLAFSTGGLSDPDDPALTVRDLTGALRVWIEVGHPEPARLHKAAKAAPRVVVYAHRDSTRWLDRVAAERIHRAPELEIRVFDSALIDALAIRLERRMSFALSVTDGELFIALGEEQFTGALSSRRVATA